MNENEIIDLVLKMDPTIQITFVKRLYKAIQANLLEEKEKTKSKVLVLEQHLQLLTAAE